jgi:general secretion pathway protein I
MRRAIQSAGFTLIEVMVALTIAVSALGALVSIFSTGLRSAATASHINAATTIAQSKLAEVLATPDLEDGAGKSGEIEETPYRWSATVTALPDPVPPNEGAVTQQFFRVQLLEVTVRVVWEDEKQGSEAEAQTPNVTLSTVRVVKKKAGS